MARVNVNVQMLKLAIFDMDGTIFESHLDWAKIRKDLNINNNILKEIYKNNSVNHEKLKRLERYEEENTLKTTPIEGISEFLSFLKIKNISTALVTNNNKKNCDFLLNKFRLTFDTVMTREMKLWKPSPEPFLYIMNRFRCSSGETFSIGDSHYDVFASKQSGIANIFIIKNSKSLKLSDTDNIVFFSNFFELKDILKIKLI